MMALRLLTGQLCEHDIDVFHYIMVLMDTTDLTTDSRTASEICAKCFLTECCCEADRLEDIANRHNISLMQRNEIRKQSYVKHATALLEISKKTLKTNPELRGKIKIRRDTIHRIMFYAHHQFTDEEDEYECIGKFYRGMFHHVADEDSKNFSEEETELLTEIARDFGAFDY